MKRMMTTAVAAGLAMAAMQGLAQSQDDRSGIANPPEAMVNDTPAPKLELPPVAPSAPTAKPSAAKEVMAPAPELKTRMPEKSAPVAEEDSMIVTEVPAAKNELPTGTLVRVKINQALSTASTTVGTTLLGELEENIERNGRVLVPAGTAFTATVTTVRGGKRIHGAAMMHIEPRSFTMPDGTNYPVHAALIDTDRFDDTRIDSEGNLIRRDHVGGTLAAMSLTTGGVAAAGGVIGGVPGALVGAAVGAGASTVWWLKQDRQMHLTSGATMIFQLTSPVFLTAPASNGAAE